ncbi:MAG: 5'/3'-nucleotidase SurE [Muribaculaceae bacterium]|nr:5'/3'-nucleotidase SurE [Muribaculaceae bacterium]
MILISNDDGISAKGLDLLTRIALDYDHVMVAAPTTHQSGKSSSITFDHPIRAHLIEKTERLTRYAVSGTPADCAKLALDQLLEERPRLLLSGINHGYNSGNSSIYSGTVGVALEGVFHDVPALAFSYGSFDPKADMPECEPLIRHIIERTLEHGLPRGVCLNVNFPPLGEGGKYPGLKITRSAAGKWVKEFEHRVDPHGRDYYWITGYYENDEPDNTLNDTYWLDRGWVSVTPIFADQTHYPSMPLIEEQLKL